MKVLRLLWRVLVVLFQEVTVLWKKYRTYRALKAQQQKDSIQPAPEASKDSTQPAPEASSEAETVTVAAQSSSALEPDRIHPPQPEAVASEKEAPTEAESLVQTHIPLTEVETAESLDLQWVPPGTGVQVQGILITDGFIYLGQGSANRAKTAPSFIDSELPIKQPTSAKRPSILAMDWSQDGALSYTTLSPEMRGIFLGWLATGRKERDITISALRLFLFGIERRVVELLSGDRTVDELLALILELERLEVHYAHQSNITPQIKRLIECCQVQLALSCQPETLLALLPVGQKLSMALKVALGQCIEDTRPIPMTLLWAWYQSSAVAVDLKTPAKRCESVFNFLIQTRGEQRGFSIEAGDNPPMLPVIYEPFGPGFGDHPDAIAMIDTIDITGLEAQLTALEPLIEDCTNDLDAYSRLIGRSPEAEGTPAAVALLPQELVFLSGNDDVKALQTWCQQTLATDQFVTCPAEDLLNLWPTAASGKIRKKEAELLGHLLAKFGFGYIPDVRYGQTTFNTKHPIILFRLEQLGVTPPSEDYPAALTALELMPFFESLGDVGADVPKISSLFNLAPSEQSRLVAVKQWRLDRPLTWKQTCNRVKKLSQEHQSKLAIALESLLEETVQLDDARYADLQPLIPLPERAATEIEESPEISETDPAVSPDSAEATTIPENSQASESSKDEELEPLQESEAIEEEAPAPVFTLNTQLIAQRNQESQVASGLLSDIFEEEDAIDITPPVAEISATNETQESDPPTNESSSSLSLGLDEFHWHLLKKLGQKESWKRSELEAFAQDQGLLLDGALENINDVAFDHCDEALTEGDDPIEVNDWVYEELQAA